MNRIKINPYVNLTNEQLLDITIEEMDKLKILSKNQDIDEYQKAMDIVNQLILEVKSRNLSIKRPLLVKRIFNKQ